MDLHNFCSKMCEFRNPLSLHHYYTILLDVAIGMNYIHMLKVIHRDLSLSMRRQQVMHVNLKKMF